MEKEEKEYYLLVQRYKYEKLSKKQTGAIFLDSLFLYFFNLLIFTDI